MCVKEVAVHFGQETWVDVQQECEEEAGTERTWICGDQAEVDEEDEEDRGFVVRSGMAEAGAVRRICVIGTQVMGTKIPLGQPLAIRRTPKQVERLSFETLQEAIKEGEQGLRQYEERKGNRVHQNRTHQCFTPTQ